MSSGADLRIWAVQMRALLELSGMREMTLRNDSKTYEYVIGRGLRVEVEQGEGRPWTYEFPEVPV